MMTEAIRMDRWRAAAARAREAKAERRQLPCQHGEGANHDCAYVDARNRLIPRADELARTIDVFGRAKVDDAAFAAHMDSLAIETGIMRAPGPWLAEAKMRAPARRRMGSAGRAA